MATSFDQISFYQGNIGCLMISSILSSVRMFE